MKIAGFLIGFLLIVPAFAWAGSEGYGYPIDDSYAATILGTPQNLRPDARGEVPVKTVVLETDQKKPEIRRSSFGIGKASECGQSKCLWREDCK